MSSAEQNKAFVRDAALHEAQNLRPSAAQAIGEMLEYQKVMGSPIAYYRYPLSSRDEHSLSTRGLLAKQDSPKKVRSQYRYRYRLTKYGREVASRVKELHHGSTGDQRSEEE